MEENEKNQSKEVKTSDNINNVADVTQSRQGEYISGRNVTEVITLDCNGNVIDLGPTKAC